MKKLSILALLLFSAISMQAVSIKGFVIDKKTNVPIIGAIVTVEGQNIGAQTDFDGRFVIKDVESGTDKLLVKSIGYKDHTRTITISDKNDIDLGKIYLKTSRSKHYNRIMLSFNPTRTPILYDESSITFGCAKGIAISYIRGYRPFDNIALELGAKYNFTWDSLNKRLWFHPQDETAHAKAIHHSISTFINLAVEKSFKDFAISPYIGVYWRKFVYSKSEIGLNGKCEVHKVRDEFQEPSFNCGAHIGIGLKYQQYYLGGEFGQDFHRGCYNTLGSVDEMDNNDHMIRFNWSVSIGYEF